MDRTLRTLYSAEAEQAVIGAMLIEPRCIPAVVSELKPEEISSDTYRQVYDIIVGMFNRSEAVDAVMVAEAAKRVGIENAERIITDMVSIMPSVNNVGGYVQIIRDKALRRSALQIAEEIQQNAIIAESGADLLDAAEREIYLLRQGRQRSGFTPIGDSIATVYSQATERQKTKGRLPGLPSGLNTLDNMILGLNKSDLILLASRPAMGKTSMAMNIAVNVAKRTDHTVCVFSLEMSKEQLAMRLLAGEAFVESKKLQMGTLDKEEWRKVSAAVGSLSKVNLLINDNSMTTVAEMNAQCRRVNNLGLVVIDYLQLMSNAAGTNAESRQQTVSEISRMLKIMAKELNVPVLCLSQLSRASTKREDKRPVLSDLRESGSLEQDADIVLGIHRKNYYDSDSPSNEAELIVMKNRHGSTGSIPLVWMPQYTTFAARAEA